jgi:heat shock protein HspQ
MHINTQGEATQCSSDTLQKKNEIIVQENKRSKYVRYVSPQNLEKNKNGETSQQQKKKNRPTLWSKLIDKKFF